MQNTLVSEESKTSIKKHYFHFFKLLTKLKLVPYANYEESSTLKRSVVGIPFPFYNFVYTENNYQGDLQALVHREKDYFKNHSLPFVWLVDEHEQDELREELLDNEFVNVGVLQGLVGSLERDEVPAIAEGFNVEKVETKKDCDEFCNTMGIIFSLDPSTITMISESIWKMINSPNSPMHSWVVKHENEVVSTVSIFIQDEIASFWNGTTKPEYRNQGLCTALGQIAANEAIDLGCTTGASYTMSDGMALGICSKFGLSPIWKFNGFISPTH